MSRDQAENQAPLEDVAQLRALFADACKGDAPLGVGTEHEKFGYDALHRRPLPYEGPHGIGALLGALAERHGWAPLYDQGNILALERDGGAVTLEPGGQLELSGRVTRTIFETRDELQRHLGEVALEGSRLGQRWTHFAIQPWDALDEVPWMPKSRYQVMRNYLPRRGALAHWMMKMTCTVQANFDFRTEADAMEIIRLCCSVGPLATALFAMSPTHLGRPSGWATWRMNIWDNTDPDRCGIPDFMLDPSAGFDDYVNWLLDVPMFFITRQGRYIDCAGVPFRQFMAHGHEGHRATWGDWQLHQSTAFPDIRLKQYLELRTCDAGPADRLLAMPALFKGLLYDAQARREAFELVGTLDAPRARRFARVAAQDGLAGRWEHLTIEDAAASLVAIARRGLDRQAGPGEPSEACFLDALLCHDTGRPLDASRRWLQQWQACGGDRDAMIRLYEVASHE